LIVNENDYPFPWLIDLLYDVIVLLLKKKMTRLHVVRREEQVVKQEQIVVGDVVLMGYSEADFNAL
jgi:hypothetical protein